MKPVIVEVDIERSPAEVFAFISDFENNPRFQRGMRTCTWTSPPPHGVASTYDQVAHFLGKDIVSSFVVREWDQDRRVRIESTSGPFTIIETRVVEPRGSGSHVTAIVEGDASGFFRIAEPLQRALVARSVRRDYQQDLKRLLERAD